MDNNTKHSINHSCKSLQASHITVMLVVVKFPLAFDESNSSTTDVLMRMTVLL